MLRIFGGLSAAATLTACATVHDARLPDVSQNAVEAADVLYSFECELAESLTGEGATGVTSGVFKNKAVRAAFNLSASVDQSLGPKVDVSVPSGLAVVSLGATFAPSKTTTRSSEFRVSYDTNRLKPCTAEREAKYNLTRIRSGLGLADWARQIDIIRAKIDTDVTLVNYTFSFDIGYGLSGSSKVARTNPSESKATFAFLPSGSRTSSHKITMTFEELKQSVPKGSDVVLPSSVQERLDRVLDSVIERAIQ